MIEKKTFRATCIALQFHSLDKVFTFKILTDKVFAHLKFWWIKFFLNYTFQRKAFNCLFKMLFSLFIFYKLHLGFKSLLLVPVLSFSIWQIPIEKFVVQKGGNWKLISWGILDITRTRLWFMLESKQVEHEFIDKYIWSSDVLSYCEVAMPFSEWSIDSLIHFMWDSIWWVYELQAFFLTISARWNVVKGCWCKKTLIERLYCNVCIWGIILYCTVFGK